MDLAGCSAFLRVLSDPTRVRLLALIEREELTVAELAAVTRLAQPRVSTHLAKLKELALVRDRRAGVSAYYRFNGDADSETRKLWEAVRDAAEDAMLSDDARRLAAVLDRRSQRRAWADSVAGDMERHYSPGRTWEALARGFVNLLELGDVVDVGSGDGVVAELVAPHAKSITCIDASPRVVEAARKRLAGIRNVQVLEGDMHATGLPAARYDLVLMMHALPYSEKPGGRGRRGRAPAAQGRPPARLHARAPRASRRGRGLRPSQPRLHGAGTQVARDPGRAGRAALRAGHARAAAAALRSAHAAGPQDLSRARERDAMDTLPWKEPARVAALEAALAARILVIDGAMGTMLQAYTLDEAGYRGQRFRDGHDAHAHDHAGRACDLKGNNDLLTLTQPEIVRAVHRAYLEAGADLVETNTFNATAIAQADYHLEHLAYELNREGARIVREECERMTALTPERPRFCIGVLGPTNRSASISPDVNNPGFRNVRFADLVAAYTEAARGLVDGGADLIMIETIFDVLNAKAAIYALEELFDAIGARLPLMISGTITDLSGRTLSGQTADAFWYSVRHARPLAVGLNCALGATELRALRRPAVAGRRHARSACIPMPGCRMPSASTTTRPSTWRELIGDFARAGMVDIVGGCCGTTPAHISAIAAAVAGVVPRWARADTLAA